MSREDLRTPDRLRAHYLVERALADQVRSAATFEERRRLVSSMYEQLFALVPDHPRLLLRDKATAERRQQVAWNLAQLAPWISPGCTFLELGAGDCALAAQVAEVAGLVYAVDISDQTGGHPLPVNCALVISDGRSVDVPAESVDVAFSDQLMEHLHPDDAMEQLLNIRRCLKPGGVYVCVTPNRLYGPTDVSGAFDEVATGFHLREYCLREVRQLFERAGFGQLEVYIGARGWYARSPAAPLEAIESALEWLPYSTRRSLAKSKPMRALLGLRVAVRKPA
jgi:SAM-dependent methyltransferase